MRHETGPQICSFCHAVSAFAVLKKVSCGRINVSSDIFRNRLSYGLWSFPRVSAIIGVCETSSNACCSQKFSWLHCQV